MSGIEIAVAIERRGWAAALPDAAGLAEGAVRATLTRQGWDRAGRTEVSVVLTDDQRVRKLNRDHRGQDKPTNVLAFPLAQAGDLRRQIPLLLGDVVLALETCRREARARKLGLANHARHLVVHGTLHLLGYDHVTESEADEMEALESAILKSLGVPDPYRGPA